MDDDEITSEVVNQQNRILVRMAYGASATGFVLLCSLIGWVVNECIESRQFRFSGDRYTQQDGSRDREEFSERLSKLRDDMTRMQVTLERIEKGM